MLSQVYPATITKLYFNNRGLIKTLSEKIDKLNDLCRSTNTKPKELNNKLPFILTSRGYVKVITVPETLVDKIIELINSNFLDKIELSLEELKELKDSMVIELAGGYMPLLEHKFKPKDKNEN